MKLVPFEKKHSVALAEMLVEFSEYHLRLLNQTKEDQELFQEAFEEIEILTTGKHHCYMGIDDHQIIGFIVLDERGKEVCWIDEVYVREDVRRRGYGSQMIKDAIHLCQALGFEAVSIDVVPRNIEALRLYLKLGFDSLSLLTLRHDFKENQRDQTIELFEETLKY